MTKERLRNKNSRSQRQHRCRNKKDSCLEQAAEAHPKFSVTLSARALQQKRESTTERREVSRNRLCDEAIEATRTNDRQRKQKTHLHRGLEGYQTFDRIIFNPAEHRCLVCSRLMYEISLTNSRVCAQQVRFFDSTDYTFTVGESIRICSKCVSFFRR